MSESEEDYQFEYESDEESEPDVEIENQYYNAKGQKEDEPAEALAGFELVVSMQEEKDEWGFKALSQMVKLNFQLGNHDEMIAKYKEMLTYIRSAVTRNMSEKKINKILDRVSSSDNAELLQEFYMTTLSALQESNNERLWFKTNLKLGGLCFSGGDFTRLKQILKELHKSCQGADGEDDVKKGTQLQEIYALEIQMYTEMKDNVNLKSLYERALRIKSAIPHPRIIGLIRECGGKMHMSEHKWEAAYTDFFEAFKRCVHPALRRTSLAWFCPLCCTDRVGARPVYSYDEAGNQRRIACLKYLVLANMLNKSDLDPFNAQEAKPYKADPEIVAMTKLVQAFHSDNIAEFERILRDNRKTVMEDPFIRNYIEDLLRTIRTQVLLKLVKPYTKISIAYLASEAALNVPQYVRAAFHSSGARRACPLTDAVLPLMLCAHRTEVETLVVGLILDGVLKGHIDQVDQILHLTQSSETADKYSALDKWAKEITDIAGTLAAKVSVSH